METSVLLSPELIASLPPAVLALIEQQAKQIQSLTERVAQLEAQLNQNSSNSSKPPSSDPPSVQPTAKKPPSGNPRGGQPGHPKHQRTLLEPDAIIEHKPAHCSHCQHPLTGDDPNPTVDQVIDLPQKLRYVLHHHRHTLKCPSCLHSTTAGKVPEAACGFGPKLQAMTSYLSGVGRMGKRPIRQLCEEVLDIPLSLGSISKLEAHTSKALHPIYGEAKDLVQGKNANVDETSWKQGKQKAWLWVAVTKLLSVFLIHRSRSREAFDVLLGSDFGILTTDRYAVYSHLAGERRQVCWAHLRRDFQAIIDRKSEGNAMGEDLLLHANLLFEHWQRVRDGTLTRRGFRNHYGSWLRSEVKQLLERGKASPCAKTASICEELARVEASLWTFMEAEGVEPTNNAAERALRHAVCWRKTSYGTDSERGSRFVERMLTVVASCRQQGRQVLQFVKEAIQSHRNGTTRPSLIPTGL